MCSRRDENRSNNFKYDFVRNILLQIDEMGDSELLSRVGHDLNIDAHSRMKQRKPFLVSFGFNLNRDKDLRHMDNLKWKCFHDARRLQIT